MAGVSPWHVNVPTPPKPRPVVGPQNIGLPGYRPGDPGNPYPGLAAPQPVQAAAPVAPPPPPPPPDFNALTLADPQYITAQQDRAASNKLAMDAMLKAFKGRAQGYQDNANAHGALFSGAAVNAQRYAGQQYADQAAQQAAGNLQGQHQDYNTVWNRLLQQLGGGA